MKTVLALLAFAAMMHAARAQVTGPPMGGPSGRFIGPPDGKVASFLGVWDLTWQGPIESGCPCRGSLTITATESGQLRGLWKMKGAPATLHGPVGYNQNVWIGQFEQSDDADFPMRGHFRLEARDEQLLTGSYQPDGTAIPFTWTARR